MQLVTLDEYTRDLQTLPGLKTSTTISNGRSIRSSGYSSPTACPTCGFGGGEVGYLKTEYPIGHPRFGSIIRCPACGDGNLAQRLRETSQLSGWLLGASFQDFKVGTKNKDAYKAALNVAQEPRGWLTLWGGYGEGKTHLLAAAVNQATARRIGAAYFVLPDLLNTLRDSFSAGDQEEGYTARYSRLLDIPLLVIDEMDKARKTEWSLEALFTLTDARYRRRGSQGTIFATNMQPDVTDPVLGYLASRMFDRDSCQVISLNGGDYRRVER